MTLSPITINGASLPKQPTLLRDYREWKQTENEALDGGMQRNRIATAANPVGYKYVAEMSWDKLDPSSFNTLMGLFVTGSGVLYSNPSSKYGALTYSGLPFVEEPDPYQPGESLNATFKVRIRQV